MNGNGVGDLLVVVVTYNSAAVIAPLLESMPLLLRRLPDSTMVVVDNGSTDDTLRLVDTALPKARVLPMGRNAGYASAINAGVAHAWTGGDVLVLNPDARPEPGSVEVMLDLLHADERTGIVVPAIVDESGGLKFSLRREPAIGRALSETLLGGHRAGRLGLGEQIRAPREYVPGREVDWATGAAVLISGLCLDTVGPWDESFFLYSEETDFMLRARDAGFATRYCPGARVVHSGGDMERSPFLWSLVARNRVRLYRRRRGRWRGAVYWAVALVNELSRASTGSTTHREAARVLLGGRPQP